MGGLHVVAHQAVFLPVRFPALDWISPTVCFYFLLAYCWVQLMLSLPRTCPNCSCCSCMGGLSPMLACWHHSWELQLHVQPWTEGVENCANSSMTSCLLTVVVYIRMKRIRHGWVLLLTLLASARECVLGCICSIKKGCLKWDRGWQSGQLENPLQDAQTHRNIFRNNGQGKNHMHILWMYDWRWVHQFCGTYCGLQAQLRALSGHRPEWLVSWQLSCGSNANIG